MLAAYDLTCCGLRDPRGIRGNPFFAWRLGSSRNDAMQESFRVVVTSLSSGDAAWDSGRITSRRSVVAYGGKPLVAGEGYAWFVTVWDDAGQTACSVPAAFFCSNDAEAPTSDDGPQRVGMVWTSDESINNEVEHCSAFEDLVGTNALRLVWDWPHRPTWQSNDCAELVRWAWHDVVGLVDYAQDFGHVCVRVPEERDLEFAQGTLLAPCGLICVRWEKKDNNCTVRMSLPPGISGTIKSGVSCLQVSSGTRVWNIRNGALYEEPSHGGGGRGWNLSPRSSYVR